MNNLEIGDRVELVGEACNMNINVGDVGTVVANSGRFIGVDFDREIGGHSCIGRGRIGHCWNIPREDLEKLEETKEEVKEETKADTLEQKILEVLREEIGVDIGEEFDVYENGEKQWTCKFEENGHLVSYKSGGFEETFIWKYWIFHFDKYVFKRKPFVPEYGEDYFFLGIEYDEIKSITFRALQSTWIGSSIDDGMLAVGNIFRTEEEALKRRDKLSEKLKKLKRGE